MLLSIRKYKIVRTGGTFGFTQLYLETWDNNCTYGSFFLKKKRKEKENTECHYIFLVMLLSIIKNTDYHYPLHCHLNCSPFIYIKICKIIVSYISQGQKFSKYIYALKKYVI